MAFTGAGLYGYWRNWQEFEPVLNDSGESTGYFHRIECSDFSPTVYNIKDAAKLALFDELWPAAACFDVTEDDEE